MVKPGRKQMQRHLTQTPLRVCTPTGTQCRPAAIDNDQENCEDVTDDVVTLRSFVVAALCSLLGTGVGSLKFVDGGYPGELRGYIGDTAAA